MRKFIQNEKGLMINKDNIAFAFAVPKGDKFDAVVTMNNLNEGDLIEIKTGFTTKDQAIEHLREILY